jgi:tetratricopeptide (TPR) repeat protein
MNATFIDIIQKLIAEQGKEALLNSAKCKAFLADYTKGDHKKESRLLLQALEAGVQKTIDTTTELEICKQQQIRVLQEEHFLTAEAAADTVDTLAFVLRGEQGKGALQGTVCANCGKELQKEWKICPYCGTSTAKTGQVPLVNSNTKRTYGIGRGYFEAGRYDEAFPHFDEAVRRDPNFADAFFYRGFVYLRKDQYDMAIKDFTESLRLDPNHALAYANRGQAYRRLGQRDQAIQDLEKAVSLYPNYAWAKEILQEIRGY